MEKLLLLSRHFFQRNSSDLFGALWVRLKFGAFLGEEKRLLRWGKREEEAGDFVNG